MRLPPFLRSALLLLTDLADAERFCNHRLSLTRNYLSDLNRRWVEATSRTLRGMAFPGVTAWILVGMDTRALKVS